MVIFCEKYPIIEKTALAKGIFSVTIDAPELADEAEAGQFVSIRVGGFTLRRPISICEIDRDRGTVRFVFEIRGKGTDELSHCTEGQLLDIMGPLGKGFSIPRGSRIIVVGGGIGTPPLLEAAGRCGSDCTAILGFRDYSRIILKDEFEKYCGRTVICTDDGSVGFHGTVAAPLDEELKKGGCAAVLACGPEPMLKAVIDVCGKNGVPCQVSLEQRMGCGVGACVVCSCMTVRDGREFYSRVCKDGPVFNAEEVRFNG